MKYFNYFDLFLNSAFVQPGSPGSVLQQTHGPGGRSHQTGKHQDIESVWKSAGDALRAQQTLLFG